MMSNWFISEEVTGQNEAAYQASANNPDIYIEAEEYGTVAEIGGGDLKTRRRHARLIAAAPDLLAALEEALQYIPACEARGNALDAIEKAKGHS